MSKKYTALTIGPIHGSMVLAKKTRELWAASFIFSWLMRKVIEVIRTRVDDDQFIIPNPDGATGAPTRAGIFPDRLILESDDGLYKELQEAVDKALDSFCKQVKPCLNGVSEDEIKTYFRNYFKTYIAETEIDLKDSHTKSDDDNPIFIMNKILANCELQDKYIPCDKELFLRVLENFAKQSGVDFLSPGKSFPSLLRIAIKGLELEIKRINDAISNAKSIKRDELKSKTDKNNDEIEKEIKSIDEDDFLWEGLIAQKDIKQNLKTAHRYVAIVQADGDNVGALIKSIYANERDKIQTFSKALADFAGKAANEIEKYGGEPVYAGGDDLLFFAPVVTKDKNVFDLIDVIDDVFMKKILDNGNLSNVLEKAEKTPSMSYGVSITYFKYPMHEAIEQAKDLLFNKAKTGDKNAIAFKIQKHSGGYFEDVIFKDTEFAVLINKIRSNADTKIISSLIYNLENQKAILKEIAADNSRLDNFFKNFYDETVHLESANNAFIQNVKDLVHLAFCENKDNPDKALNKVYSGLRLIKFIRRDYDAK